MSSLAEVLGFTSDARVVIPHVDDVGMSHGHNLGFFEVLEAGVATSGSVLVPCPWFPEVVAYARRRPGDLDLGVHLCLNSEFSQYRWSPVVGAGRVRSLIDADGYFWPSTSETLEHADPEEARVELRAQIERAIASGIDVTHLDAHMGTVMMRDLLQVYIDLGREYALPLFFPRPTEALLEEVGHPEIFGRLPEVLEQHGASDLLMVDHAELRSLSFEPERAADHYRRVIHELEPGVTHFVLHPARADDEIRALAPESWRQRDAERRLFAGPDVARWLAEERVERVGYRRLRDLLRA